MPGYAGISRPAARKSDRDTSFLHLRVLPIHDVPAVPIAIRHAIDAEDTPGHRYPRDAWRHVFPFSSGEENNTRT